MPHQTVKQQLIEVFTPNGEWMVRALESHDVLGEWNALDLVDLEDEELLEWINGTLLLVLHDRVSVKWSSARELREDFVEETSWFLEEYQQIVVALLKGMLNQQDAETKLCAAYVLSALGSDGAVAVSILKKALRSPENSIRYTAADALGSIGPAAGEAMDELVRLANFDQDRGIRDVAREAMTRLRSRK